jgi:hypothetical protein
MANFEVIAAKFNIVSNCKIVNYVRKIYCKTRRFYQHHNVGRYILTILRKRGDINLI